MQLRDALTRFHRYRAIFEDLGIRSEGFALPRQHSLTHYFALIRAFGAPNGLCSSITESKHITAVKKPWRRSNHYKALGQILLTNQRLDKLAATRINFTECGMLEGTCLSDALKFIGMFWRFFHIFIIYIIFSETLRDEGYSGPENNIDDTDGTVENDDDDIVDGPTVLAHVELVRTIREFIKLAQELHFNMCCDRTKMYSC
jgi:hypothetical protein